MVRSNNARGRLSWSQNPKLSHWGSVLAKAMGGGGSFLGRVDPIWQAYTGFEVVGWYDRAMRGGGLSWSQNAKQSRRGLVLTNETWGHSFSGRGGPIGVE